MSSPTHQVLLMAVTDPYWPLVKLLMGMQGANGSTGAPGLTDESLAAHGTATSGASSTIDTSQTAFATTTSSYRMHTAVGNSCVIPDSADWQLSAANSDQFTVEFRFRLNTAVSSCTYLSQFNTTGSFGWSVEPVGATTSEIRFAFSPDGSLASIVNTATSGAGITTGTWYAGAVDKDATGKIRVYVNGTMLGSSTPANSAIFNSTVALGIGCTAAPGQRMDGWSQEIRITKGIARYASDGGYTLATTPFPRR